MRDRVRVYITVDTETSLGGAWRNVGPGPLPLDRTVFGRYGSRFYGIPLIMDILEEHGFRATFFIEVFCAYLLGHEEVAKVFRTVQERGHDPQLHLHPAQRFYRDFLAGQPRREQDLMFELPIDDQRQLIGEGVRLFKELSGKAPRAYRAGCYGGSERTLTALREHGIEIDSSYNTAYLGETCGFKTALLNAPVVIENVHEFPVTVFRTVGSNNYKPLEISSVSVREILATLRSMQASGCRDAVLVLHSFSLLKNLGLRFEHCRPDRIVIQRLRKLCRALSELKEEFEVVVLGEVDLRSIAIPQSQVIPYLGWVRPSIRKCIQGINRLPWL
jgi:peptidoglycan/xylan/chitin deacetylase (PgdA/CDA1 family)